MFQRAFTLRIAIVRFFLEGGRVLWKTHSAMCIQTNCWDARVYSLRGDWLDEEELYIYTNP